MNDPFFKIVVSKKTKEFGQFVIEPLPQGFGHTMGNSLRRVLLTFLTGAAISKVKIKGVRHQFSTLEGLREDIVEFILNLKKIHFYVEGEEEVKLSLSKNGPGEIRAKDITLPAGVTIANPEEYLGSLATKQATIEVTLWVEHGVGYVPSEERTVSEIGVIPVDSFFSPIRRVNFNVEETRVGRATNYDKLILEIWSDGAIDPEEALHEAAKTLVTYFDHVYNPKEKVVEIAKQSTLSSNVLQSSVEELDLSVRVTNALKKGGYKVIADFQGKSRADLEKVRNLGAKSIALIEKKLAEKGVAISS
ncbi:DNA-directed RNA polymerase subunit alpha [Candidatus Roizmanbacteria bacterium]|nr:DNA-directed RNA polymerase subunit alpha [Candidatus Roizmanbacteria bacterium]